MASSSDSVNLDDTLDNTLNNKNNTPCNECASKNHRLQHVFLPMFAGASIGGLLGLIAYVKDWL